MEIDWQQKYLEAYHIEAKRALKRFVDGERDSDFLLRALELIHTYCQIPRSSTYPLSADQAIVQLAQAIQIPLTDRSRWHELLTLWPQVIQLAEQLPTPMMYAELVKHFATIKDRRGDGIEADQLYQSLLLSKQFLRLPLEFQIDVMQQAGTTLVWQGKLREAQLLLDQVLKRTEQHIDGQDHRAQVDQFGVRSSLDVTPLWESRAYALNQIGNIYMFQGKFLGAEKFYRACWDTLNQHGETENLACVAHQALGRLWLHWQQPKRAIPLLEQGIAIRRRRHHNEGVAINAIYLAAALMDCCELDHAESLLTEALPIVRAIEDRRDCGLCHLYLGQLELLRGRKQAVIEQWQLALSYLQTVHTPLIEQRIFIHYCPWLVSIGAISMLQSVIEQLYRSLTQQGLQSSDIGRLILRGIYPRLSVK